MRIFKQLHEQGMTIVVVTHDMSVAKRAERIITLSDGKIVKDEYQ
jgi:macrolide transport system ATP-binding/permease protein